MSIDWWGGEFSVEPIETSTFTKQITALFSDDEYGEFRWWVSLPARGRIADNAASRLKDGRGQDCPPSRLTDPPPEFQAWIAANPDLGAVISGGGGFEALLGSVREAGAILRGERKPSRRTVIRSSGVRVIRERTSLSQSEFAQFDRRKREDAPKLGTGAATADRTSGSPTGHH